MKRQRKLPKSLTTVTPFSKMLALSLFILVPIGAFYLGIHYEQQTRQGFPNLFCKQWETVCDPNVVDPHGLCAPKTVCIDPTPSPVINKYK
jgi:hypothetical protein